MSKGIKVKLDKKRHLLVTTDALAQYERITGRKLLAESTMSNLSLRDVVVITWALLLHEDPRLTIDQVGDMIKPQTNMQELTYRIGEAWDIYAKEME